MEKLLRALERRFGRLALPNIAALLIAPKAAFFLWAMASPDADSSAGRVLAKLALVPQLVVQGEVWRVITFIAVPPTHNPLFFLIYAYLLFLYCSGLQARWGTVRLYAYLFFGWACLVTASFVAMALEPRYVAATGFFQVELTLMLAFATFYPNFVFHLMFILPVKVKWLAWIAAAGLVLQFAEGPWDQLAGYAPRLLILGAVGNYLLFFGPGLVRRLHQQQQASNRRRRFEEAMRRGHEERERLNRRDDDEDDGDDGSGTRSSHEREHR